MSDAASMSAFDVDIRQLQQLDKGVVESAFTQEVDLGAAAEGDQGAPARLPGTGNVADSITITNASASLQHSL